MAQISPANKTKQLESHSPLPQTPADYVPSAPCSLAEQICAAWDPESRGRRLVSRDSSLRSLS